MLSSVPLSSVCRLSVTLVHPPQPLELFGNVFTPFGTLAIRPLKSKKSKENFTEIVTGEPLHWGGGIAKYSDFDLSKAISGKRCKIGGKLVLITNSNSCMSFRLVPKLVTLNDHQRHIGPYFALFHRIWQLPGHTA